MSDDSVLCWLPSSTSADAVVNRFLFPWSICCFFVSAVRFRFESPLLPDSVIHPFGLFLRQYWVALYFSSKQEIVMFCVANLFGEHVMDSVYGLFFPRYLIWHNGFILKFRVILSDLLEVSLFLLFTFTASFCVSHDSMQFL